ncbi:MAG: DUF2809 domain-containing protein [Clostridia bacterium]|nr:DUF2809 domain-containing protein [Clostridia bacterium]
MIQRKRILYAALFFVLLVTEVCIALFVHDRFIRPYGGDVLVTVLICCFCRIFFPEKPAWLPMAVFLFAAAVEAGQYFDFVSLLGLGNIRFFRILLGSTFSVPDLFCYLAGCLLFALGESMYRIRKGESE